jgi:molybdopterin adenylyltransferase
VRLRVGILTVSDRSARGERWDASGPALVDEVRAQGWDVFRQEVLPDDFERIRSLLESWADSGELDIILTTGGTGLSQRDVTPEATAAVIDRVAPGLAETMRATSLQATPHAMLSRATAGTRSRTLIINLPGSPKGAIENLRVVSTVLPHAVQLLTEDPGAEAGHKIA